MSTLKKQDMINLVLAEYKYWRDAEVRDDGLDLAQICMGATGACANIVAAVYGRRAPWHPPIVSQVTTLDEKAIDEAMRVYKADAPVAISMQVLKGRFRELVQAMTGDDRYSRKLGLVQSELNHLEQLLNANAKA